MERSKAVLPGRVASCFLFLASLLVLTLFRSEGETPGLTEPSGFSGMIHRPNYLASLIHSPEKRPIGQPGRTARQQVGAVLGYAGGTLRMEVPAFPSRPLMAEFPPFSLSGDVRITIAFAQDASADPGWAKSVSPSIRLGPQRVALLNPVLITLPYDETLTDADTYVFAAAFDERTQDWVSQETLSLDRLNGLITFASDALGTFRVMRAETDFDQNVGLNPTFAYEHHAFVPNLGPGLRACCREIAVFSGWHFAFHKGAWLRGRYTQEQAYTCVIPALSTVLAQSYRWLRDHDDSFVASSLWLGLKRGVPQLLGLRQESGKKHLVLVVGWRKPHFILYDANRLALAKIRYDPGESDLEDYVHPADPDHPYAFYRYYNWHPETQNQMEAVCSLCPADNPEP